MNLPLCRKENRKNEPKTAQSGGFLCKMTKKSQKIRHFARAPTFVSAGISAFWHFSTKNEAKFVQNYLLTNSRKYGIIVSESEGTTMTKEEILERLIDGYIKYHEEPPCDHFGQICPNYINQTCTCNYDYTNCEIYVKKLLTNRK